MADIGRYPSIAMHDFATIVNTKRYGEVLILDDFGDVTPHSAGHINLYCACGDSITMLELSRLCPEMVDPIYRSTIDPDEIERLITTLDAKGSNGRIAQSHANSEHHPYAKILYSAKYGPIVIVKDGDMRCMEPHLSVHFRPTRPVTVRGFTLVKPTASDLGLSEDLKKLLRDPQAVRQALDHRFKSVDLDTAESYVDHWLTTYPDSLPPVTFT